MPSIHSQLLDRISHAAAGRVFTPKDFLDVGSRDVVDKVLSRLTRAGTLSRVGRGLYVTPKRNEALGIDVPADLDELVGAVARQTGSRVAPSGAVAANRLGLSTQVPAKPVYLSDGRTRDVRVGNYVVRIKHVPPKDLPLGSPTSALVFQALRFIGRSAVTEHEIARIRSALSPIERTQLLADAQYASDWVGALARSIATASEHPANG